MKKMFLLLGLCSIVFAGCTKKDSAVSSVADAVTNGTWRVTHFSERTNNETSDFTGYTFTFQSNGKVLAAKNGVIKEGNWSESTSSQKLVIALGTKTDANKPLGELSDEWVIVSKTETKINLADDNSSSNELLEFTKN
ncbi:MAG: hypothetical protein H7122_13495 [Chitinophagaceae bacterium]|nr:hypothetical protein [Chitinophagaceae bacterium]